MPVTPFRPNTFGQFNLWRQEGKPLQLTCRLCKAEFSPDNTRSPAGWRDTQIIGWCEDCFDENFEEEDEEEEDEEEEELEVEDEDDDE